MKKDKVFRDLMECDECPRIKARIACIPGGYPPSEALFDLGRNSNTCMYECRIFLNEVQEVK